MIDTTNRPAGAQQLGNSQRLGLVAAVVVVSGAVMGWNSLTRHVVAASSFNGGLDPVAIARSSLEQSALHWISIRSDATGTEVDFTPILTDAAALRSVRYGVDQGVPDTPLELPTHRHVWPLPPAQFGRHVVRLPPGTGTVSVCVTYLDGTTSPVLVYALPRTVP